MKPPVCILRTDGTNCDEETAHAFRLAGGDPKLVHMNRFRDGTERLKDYRILVIPGGFSHGDDVASGKILSLELLRFLGDQLLAFRGPILGICNGFQVLVKAGLLPFPPRLTSSDVDQEATLTHNVSGHFQCEWVDIAVNPNSPCIYTKGFPEEVTFQAANGEGRFVANPRMKDLIADRHLAPLRYRRNPNGSLDDIVGVCNPSGLIFGLMPHPERFVERTQHPNWRRMDALQPWGLRFFQNAVEVAR